MSQIRLLKWDTISPCHHVILCYLLWPLMPSLQITELWYNSKIKIDEYYHLHVCVVCLVGFLRFFFFLATYTVLVAVCNIMQSVVQQKCSSFCKSSHPFMKARMLIGQNALHAWDWMFQIIKLHLLNQVCIIW